MPSIFINVPSEELQYFYLCVCNSFVESKPKYAIDCSYVTGHRKICVTYEPQSDTVQSILQQKVRSFVVHEKTPKKLGKSKHIILRALSKCVCIIHFSKRSPIFMDNAGALLYIPHHTFTHEILNLYYTVVTGSFYQLFEGKI